MTNAVARNRKSGLYTAAGAIAAEQTTAHGMEADAFARPPADQAGVTADTAVVVNNLDRLIAGRVNDLAMLKHVAESLRAGASKADIHQLLLALAKSSRDAFQSLQTSRDALVALRREAAGDEVMPVVDPVTGLPDRESFEARLKETFEASAAASDTVLMLIEIGALQLLTTEIGPQAANRVVKRFAAILGKSVKRGDFIARISPQRFAIIFRNVLPDNVAPIAFRIHQAMQSGLSRGRDPVMQLLSVTIGITGNKAEDKSSAELLQRAQDSLIAARKQTGAGIYIA